MWMNENHKNLGSLKIYILCKIAEPWSPLRMRCCESWGCLLRKLCKENNQNLNVTVVTQ